MSRFRSTPVPKSSLPIPTTIVHIKFSAINSRQQLYTLPLSSVARNSKMHFMCSESFLCIVVIIPLTHVDCGRKLLIPIKNRNSNLIGATG